jgi:integrase
VLDFLQLEGTLEQQAKIFVIQAREKPELVQHKLMQFFSYQLERVQRKEISETTIPNYYKAAKLFCEMNDLLLNWKKISRMLPKRRNATNDRTPTIEELQKLIEYPDRRIKPIVYTMVSPGIRIGAWDYLKWKHVIPISNGKGEITAAKLRIYVGDREEYYAFVTPEAYDSLRQWMEFRAEYGEIISDESWVMRDLWQTTNVDYGFKNGLATSLGISSSYYKPTEHEILHDYLKAVDLLTINGANSVLQKQVQEQKDKARDNEYIIKGKLEDKENEIGSLKDDMDSMRDDMNNIFEILKIAKRNNGRLGKDRTMLDENGRITFGYLDNTNKIIEVHVPLDQTEIHEKREEELNSN